MKAAGIGMLDSLEVVARTMQQIAARPTGKGDMSGALRDRLPEPYLRYCTPCAAVHAYEGSFRLAALHADLVLRPGTSPRCSNPSPGSPPPPRCPSTPQQVAAYLTCSVAGEQRWVLPGTVPRDRVRTTRLLAPSTPTCRCATASCWCPTAR